MNPNEPTAVPINSSFHDNLVLASRSLLGVISVAGLLGWSYGMLVILGYYGKGAFAGPTSLLLLFPYTYLLLSLYSSFKKLSLKTLIIMGGVLNAPLVAVFTYGLLHIERYLKLTAFIPIVYILGWTFLCIARWFVDHHVSSQRRAITLTVLFGFLLVGGVTVWPHTIDHEEKALHFLQAAAHGDPVNARANFSESLRHATLIRRKADSLRFIQQIAMVQANRKFYDDSSNTIKTYLDTNLEQKDREWLTTSIIRTQLKNKDYALALSTARPLNCSERFHVQPLTLEAESLIAAGRPEEARQILNVAITLANEQRNSNLQTYDFSYIADAQAKMGWHDGALESARQLGTRRIIGLLGSIGVREAEAGYKESARDSLRVIYETVHEAVAKCVKRETVEERDQCLSDLVDELGDDRFFNLARSVASRISSLPKRDLASIRISEFGTRYLNSDLEGLITK